MTRKDNLYRRLVSILAAGALTGLCQPVWSSAFQLTEQNASQLGTAYAGAASAAEDASTGYYNPAGLTHLRQEQVALSSVFINSHTKLSTASATPTFSIPGLTPTGNFASQTRKDNVAISPGLHYAKRLNDHWVFGFNVASPFGLKTSYKNDTVARYVSTRSQLRTVDVSPSLAYRFDSGLSLGAGIDAVYAQAKLDSVIGSGVPSSDGMLVNTADNWGMGYHIGALFEFNESTRLGAQYRSKVKVKMKGDSLLEFAAAGINANQSVRSDLTLPENASVSIYHDLSDQWALMTDVQWTRWTRFNQIELRYANGTKLVYPENFKNTVRVAVGTIYQYNDCWKFKLGLAFDKTSTRDASRRISIPDQNRTMAAIGTQYRFTKNLALDFGYSHVFFKKANINDQAPQTVGFPITSIQSLRGTSKTHADLVGIQLTWDLV